MGLTRPSFRDLVAGAVAALVTLAGWLTLGVLAYASFGRAAPEFGIPAACVAVSVGALVVALAGKSVMPSGGLSSATILIFAAALGELHADPALRGADAAALRVLVAAVSCAVVLMGVFQVLFGLLRLGSLAKYVPQPVLAGFMNGVAILVFIAQVPVLLGVDASVWADGFVAALARAQPATLVVGLTTAVVAWTMMWRFPRAPGALLGLLAGCLLYAAIHFLLPSVPLGPLTGTVPTQPSLPVALAPLFGAGAATEAVLRHAESIAVTALLLAIVGSLEATLNALAIDRQMQVRHDPNRELIAFGAANVASGFFGGLPVVYWRARAASMIHSGATSRWAAAACAVVTLAVYLVGGPLIGLLPLAVLAGVMLTVAWSLADRWTHGLLVRGASGERSGEWWLNLALIAVVMGITLWRGFVAGVLLGVLLAMGLFIYAMNRSLVRARYDAAVHPSRRVYPHTQETFLQPARAQIEVLELEGALFFGNADRLAAEVDRLGPALRFIVLDLKRISTVDASGAAMLAQLAGRLVKTGRSLLLAAVAHDNRHGRALRAFGAGGNAAQDWFADADQAIEAAEHRLLAEAGLAIGDAEIALDQCALLDGLDAAQRARLCNVLQARTLAANEQLFRQGDAGDCLYVLTRGSITVSSDGEGGNRLRQRYVSFSPGMILGETAMLDGQGRTANAFADVPSVVHALSREALERLGREDPALAFLMMTNIARHQSQRLRHAAAAWHRAAA
jgi:MFS superfamily sulfate permease-like transporter